MVLNTPLLPGTELPFTLKQYTLPIVSSFVAQDAMRAERFLEGGSAYAMDVADTDRYREPFLESMMPGLALVDVMGKCKWEDLLTRIQDKVKSSDLKVTHVMHVTHLTHLTHLTHVLRLKVRVAWGMDDPYLPSLDAKAFCDATGAEFVPVEGKAGFIVNMDYPESVCKAVGPFLRSAGPAPAASAPGTVLSCVLARVCLKRFLGQICACFVVRLASQPACAFALYILFIGCFRSASQLPYLLRSVQKHSEASCPCSGGHAGGSCCSCSSSSNSRPPS